MARKSTNEIISTLDEFVSTHKKKLIERILEKRTRHITLVFENIEKPHNISAVLRTAECLGIQDIHFIKNKGDYSVNPTITQGATKWLTLNHYDTSKDNVGACYTKLREAEYSIYATSLHKTSTSLEEIDPNKKLAIVFGNEADGISREAGEKADGYVHIPMFGFTESFNLSVSAALCLNTLRSALNGSFPGISHEEKRALQADWYRKIVREADLILKSKGVEI